MSARVAVVVVALTLLSTGCTALTGTAGPEVLPGAAVEVEDQRLVLTGTEDADVVLATLPESEGTFVHAVLRPGEHDQHTVVALTRVQGPAAEPRYELRYLVAGHDGISDLFWFPRRFQVDAHLAEVLDVPPVPVWAPDGSAVAWIEWAGEGTHLRMVGWHDQDARRSNPEELVAAYRLDAVPSGTQLEAWMQDDDQAVLVGRSEEHRWSIELDFDADDVVRPVRGEARAS